MGKIDLVIPMVFPDDPLWQSDFKHLGYDYQGKKLFAARWRSWGTEKLAIRAARKFMPWLGKIHILLARESQIQDWMKYENINIVLHKDFIPQKFLPTFNANTIEMFLHKIPDLSERFIYSNDDMFPLSLLDENQFFDEGKPCQKYVLDKYPKEPNVFQRFCMNGLNLIAKDFGVIFKDAWLVGGHSMSPFLKSTCEKVWSLYKKQILASITPGRNENNYNQYIYAYYQHLSGNYSKNIPPRMILSVAYPLQEIERVLRKGFGVVCVNDHEADIDFEAYRTTVYNALKQKISAN